MFGCCKTFSGKYIFSGNANFRKRKMFPWCLVALQKIFRKIFSGVWKRRRKTQIQKNTSHNPGKNHPRRQIQSDDRAVDRDPRLRSRSSLLREIAIHGAIAISRSTAPIAIDAARSRSREARHDRDRRLAIDGADWSSTGFAGNHQTGLELAFLTRARSLPFFGIHLK